METTMSQENWDKENLPSRVDAAERIGLLTGAIEGTIVQFEKIAADAANSIRAQEFRMYASNLREILVRWGAGRVRATGPEATHARQTHPTRTTGPVPATASARTGATNTGRSKRRVPTTR